MHPLHCLGLEAVNYEHHLPYFNENRLYTFKNITICSKKKSERIILKVKTVAIYSTKNKFTFINM